MAQQRDGALPNNLNPLDIWRSNRAAIDEAQRRHDELDMQLIKARADYQAVTERIATTKQAIAEGQQAVAALDAQYNQIKEHIKALRHEAEVLLYNKVQLMKAIDEANEHNETQQRNMDAMHKHHQALVATAEQAHDEFAAFAQQRVN